MSDELRGALDFIQEAMEKSDCPIYLHGRGGQPFAVLVPLRMDPTEPMDKHSHLEGDEDEE